MHVMFVTFNIWLIYIQYIVNTIKAISQEIQKRKKNLFSACTVSAALYQSGTTNFVNISTANSTAPKSKYLHRSFPKLES